MSIEFVRQKQDAAAAAVAIVVRLDG